MEDFDDDKIDFSSNGQGGATRIVGIYEDPLVKAGIVQKDSVFDGSRTFINDLKLDNCMFDPDEPDSVLAIFDWDMTTLGDPLIDVGTL